MAMTPTLAAFARHVDQRTSRQIAEMEQKQDWQGLLALAQAQLQADPTRAHWWWLQGYALGRMGDHAGAVQSYKEAVRISPEDEETWLSLGQAQDELGQAEQAVAAYRQALRYRPESAPVYLALADHHKKHGRPDLAIPNYRECVRYRADAEQCWYGLAAAYQVTGQNEERDAALEVLRKRNPAAASEFEKEYLVKKP